MGNEVRLIDAPVGLFLHGNCLGLKTEYMMGERVEAYVVASGEIFWGGVKTAEEVNNLLVKPIDPESLRPNGRWRKYSSDEWICTNCGYDKFCDTLDGGVLPDFCESCGADMREG